MLACFAVSELLEKGKSSQLDALTPAGLDCKSLKELQLPSSAT